MIGEITDSVIDWANSFGLIGLAIISSTEAAFQPVPPDLIVMPMSLSAENNFDLIMIFIVATLSSVLGSLGGYAIGSLGGRPVLRRFANQGTIRKLESLTVRYGNAGVFIAAVSPIPYKVIAWAAGAGKMNLRIFLAAGLVGRSIRFGLEVLILGFWGEEFLKILQNPLFWLITGILSMILFVPISSWWADLDPMTNLPEEE